MAEWARHAHRLNSSPQATQQRTGLALGCAPRPGKAGPRWPPSPLPVGAMWECSAAAPGLPSPSCPLRCSSQVAQEGITDPCPTQHLTMGVDQGSVDAHGGRELRSLSGAPRLAMRVYVSGSLCFCGKERLLNTGCVIVCFCHCFQVALPAPTLPELGCSFQKTAELRAAPRGEMPCSQECHPSFVLCGPPGPLLSHIGGSVNFFICFPKETLSSCAAATGLFISVSIEHGTPTRPTGAS